MSRKYMYRTTTRIEIPGGFYNVVWLSLILNCSLERQNHSNESRMKTNNTWPFWVSIMWYFFCIGSYNTICRTLPMPPYIQYYPIDISLISYILPTKINKTKEQNKRTCVGHVLNLIDKEFCLWIRFLPWNACVH